MAKVKNISKDDLKVGTPGGPLVIASAELEVKAEDVYGYTCQETVWAPADAEAEKAHEDGHAAYVQRLRDAGQLPPEEVPELDLDKAKVAELKEYAAEHGIELDGATTKAEIRAAIDAALDDQAGDDPGDPDSGDPGDPDADNDNTPED